MSNADWEIDFLALDRWMEAAYGPSGCTFETIGHVASSIISSCRTSAHVLISGVPNRIPGTVIYWTADIDHRNRKLTIIGVEPHPRPGL